MAYEADNSPVIVTKHRVYTIGGRRNGAPHALIQYTNFSGGLNDYQDYIGNIYPPTTSGFFDLPDLRNKGMVNYETLLVKV